MPWTRQQVQDVVVFLRRQQQQQQQDAPPVPAWVGRARSSQWTFRNKTARRYRVGVGGKLWEGEREVVPLEDAEAKLQELFDDVRSYAGGRDKLFDKVRERYANVTQEQCLAFLRKQESYQLHRAVHPEPVSKPVLTNRPLALWQADVTFVSPTWNGHKALLTVIDAFSKFAWAFPLRQVDGASVLRVLREELFVASGWQAAPRPAVWQTDNGGEFTDRRVQQFIRSIGVRPVQTAPHSPSAQGAIERWNRTIKALIFQLMTKDGEERNWLRYVAHAVANYNNTRHSTTGFKPCELVLLEDRQDAKVQAARDRLHRRGLRHLARTSRHNRDGGGGGGQIRVGDQVRVPTASFERRRKNKGLEKTYVQQWSRELHRVQRVIRASGRSRARYKLSDGSTRFRWEIQPVGRAGVRKRKLRAVGTRPRTKPRSGCR